MMKSMWDKKKLIWAEQFGNGAAVIDSEHNVLISLVSDVKRMIETRDSGALSRAFEELETWLDIHYANEEMNARAAHIDFTARKFEQQFELNGLFFLRGQLIVKNGEWSDSEAKIDMQFLSDWLIEHITNEEMQIKPVSKTGRGGQGIYAVKNAITQDRGINHQSDIS